MSYGLIRTECDIFVPRVDSAGGIYRRDAAKNTGDAGLYRITIQNTRELYGCAEGLASLPPTAERWNSGLGRFRAR